MDRFKSQEDSWDVLKFREESWDFFFISTKIVFIFRKISWSVLHFEKNRGTF